MPNALLLRAPTKDSPDKYEAAFSAAGYTPISVPVLETVLTNIHDLAKIIEKGPVDVGFRGVIITSARACEAWKNASELVTKSSSASRVADWTTIPFYVVGKSTASALRDIDASPLAPNNIRGEGSGTSEQLACYILDDLTQRPAKLLLLTGDKNKDTLPSILGPGGFDLIQLQVYETQGSPHFAANLTRALESNGNDTWWIVYFAPSAAEFVTPHLRLHFDLPELEQNSVFPRRGRPAFLAVIGPTTRDFLHGQLRLTVHATSPKPTPSDLVTAIAAVDTLKT